jgi:hypothetical protein
VGSISLEDFYFGLLLMDFVGRCYGSVLVSLRGDESLRKWVCHKPTMGSHKPLQPPHKSYHNTA